MIDEAPDGAILDLKVIPRAGRTAIAGVRDNALLIRLAAAPVEGEANNELITLLSRTFGVPQRHIIVLTGSRSRAKRVKVIGRSVAMVRQRLGSILE